MTKHLRFALLPLLALLCVSSPTAQASPLDLFGVGARSPGLAGTGAARTTDYDAAWLNPAGLADTAGKRLTLGMLMGDLLLYRDDARVDTATIAGIIIGGALRLPMGGSMRDRLGLGFGFQVPTQAINRVRHPLPGVPIHAILEQRSHVVSVQAAFGVRITDRFRLGIGMLALAELRGGIDVTTDAAGRFTSFSEQQLIARIAPIVGTRLLLPEHGLKLAAVFRGVSRSDYDLIVQNDLADSLPLTIPAVHLRGASQYDPLTVAVEVDWELRPDVSLSGQLAYQRWSAYVLPVSNPIIDGPPLPAHGFHDIVVPRASVEWRANIGNTQLDVRGGYSFFWSPAPEMDGLQSLLDNHRHIVSSGLGIAWPDTGWPVRLDIWAQFHALMPRTHEKDPANFGPDEPLPFDVMDTSGAIAIGGLTLGVEL